ncbi:MAG: dihydrofolate reductase [Patescibacteria group bacterium]
MAQKDEIIIIAGIGKNRELGVGSELAWRLKDDLKHFKELTTGYPIIMGRKTFDSIGKPLTNRINIVVTRDTNWSHEGVVVAHSLEKASSYAHELGSSKVFVIGGGEIYTQALPFATHLELTHIEGEEPNATTFFPAYENLFREVSREAPREEGGVVYQWARYEKV